MLVTCDLPLFCALESVVSSNANELRKLCGTECVCTLYNARKAFVGKLKVQCTLYN